jgi:hypothetical protein
LFSAETIKQLIYEDENEEPFIFCPACINPKLIGAFQDLGEIKDYNPKQEEEVSEETTDRSNLQQNTTDSSEEQQTVVSSDDNNESSSEDSEEDEDGFIFGG